MAKKPNTSELERYPRPSLAVDVVALTVEGGELRVALYRRADPPQRGTCALPGGFMHIDESIEDAAARLMAHKVGLTGVFLEQLYTFGDPRRDPRGRVVTVAYYALVDARRFRQERAHRKSAPPALSARVVRAVAGRDRRARRGRGRRRQAAAALPSITPTSSGSRSSGCAASSTTRPVGFQLLPTEFTLRQLQEVHEAVRGEPVNKDSFRRRMLASGLLEATGAHEREVVHRPAELYRFTRRSRDRRRK